MQGENGAATCIVMDSSLRDWHSFSWQEEGVRRIAVRSTSSMEHLASGNN